MKRLGWIFLLLVFARPLTAEEPLSAVRLDLASVLQSAGTSNIRMVLADEKIQQAFARVGTSASALLPHADFGVSESRQTRNLEAMGIPSGIQNPLVGPFNSFDARLSAQQALFDWGAVERLRAARAAKKLSEAERVKTREDVQALAASLYFEAKRAQEAVRFTQSLLAASEQAAEAAGAAARNGNGSPIEANKAEDAVLSARQGLQAARVRAAEKRRDLLVALSLNPETPVLFPVRESSDLWKGFDLELPEDVSAHPEIRRLEAVVEDLKAEKRAILADFLPRLTGVADYGPSGTSPSNWDTTYMLGAKLNWPLLEGGRKLFSLKQARSLLRQAAAEEKNALLVVNAETLNALDNLKLAAFLSEVTEKRYRSARQEWIFALQKFKNGVATESERYQAYSAYLKAADERSESEALLQLSFIQTAHAMGRMSQWFDKEES